ASRVLVISDALAALYGAFRGQAGLLLIAGTGSICLGMDNEGRTARSGGLGRIFGDEGSGYWIAAEAIAAALCYADGREGAASLPPLICEEFGLQDVREIIPKALSGELPPSRIAQLAAKVLNLSDSNSDARDIVRRAGNHLANLLITTGQKLNLKNPQVVFSGGLWKSPQKSLQRSLNVSSTEQQYQCQLVEPLEPPEWGAWRYLQDHPD
ncbi:MAG: BadF/BadG/BcrA/BcrD ATPase family protein, partial [bacterium]